MKSIEMLHIADMIIEIQNAPKARFSSACAIRNISIIDAIKRATLADVEHTVNHIESNYGDCLYECKYCFLGKQDLCMKLDAWHHHFLTFNNLIQIKKFLDYHEKH